MSDKSKIEWTDATWNPVRGCSVVSEGCRNCYAMQIAARFSGEGKPFEGLAFRNGSGAHWTGRTRLIEERLEDPLRWRAPRRIFVNSMSDLFHESLTDGQILRVFEIMLRCPQHVFQILTKRPSRMREWFRRWEDLEGEKLEPKLVRGPTEARKAHPSGRGQMYAEYLETLGTEPPPGCAWPTFDWMEGMRWWPRSVMVQRNIWLGVSVEDQKTADERIPLLLQTPAAVRWISAEPLLEWIDVTEYLGWNKNLPAKLDWVVAGGESGPKARPVHPYWIDSLRDQCLAADVPFFFKQWGQWQPNEDVPIDLSLKRDLVMIPADSDNLDKHVMVKVGKKEAGRLLDGREWNQFPEPKAASVTA